MANMAPLSLKRCFWLSCTSGSTCIHQD